MRKTQASSPAMRGFFTDTPGNAIDLNRTTDTDATLSGKGYTMTCHSHSAPKHNAISSTLLRSCRDQLERPVTGQSEVSASWYQGAEQSLHGDFKPTGVVSLFGSIAARLQAWNRRRLAIAELYALDDQLLRDIGIEPGHIEQFVDSAARARRAGDMPPVLRRIRNNRSG